MVLLSHPKDIYPLFIGEHNGMKSIDFFLTHLFILRALLWEHKELVSWMNINVIYNIRLNMLLDK